MKKNCVQGAVRTGFVTVIVIVARAGVAARTTTDARHEPGLGIARAGETGGVREE
jgi:hypothetical protein